ncbi:MAG: hypothetical protein FWF15_03420 [Oscillospiraceae bacterium]|nr:hypothetical protein [Oscillospiraceae bacterium]
MLISFAACGESGDDTSVAATGEVNNNLKTNETELKPDLPDKNFNGEIFTFINRGEAYVHWECFDCYAETEIGEPINDAVYRRNMVIEERYNIKITEFKASTGMERTLFNSINAGEKIYNAVMINGTGAAFLAENNVLVDLHTINYINLENPWWDKNANKDFSIGERIFFTACDIGISDKDGSWTLAFNKRILNDGGLENPYDIVKANRWTMDKMYEMAKTVSRDLDGDGKMTIDDLWGIVAESYDTYAMFFAGGERIFKNNAEGYPELVVYSERGVRVIDKYMQMVKDKEHYYVVVSTIDNPFNDGRALFYATTLYTIRNYWRDMDDDFGIIPLPKYDELQENYHHIVSIGASGAVLGVPITTPNLELTGIILEDLSYESGKTLMPAYMDICFNNKYLRDKESIDMLALCLESRVFDFSIIYDWGGWYAYFIGLNANSNVNFTSEFEKKQESTIAAMDKIIDIYKQLN